MKVTKEMMAEMRRWGSAEQDGLEALLDERKALRAALAHLRFKHDIDVDYEDSSMVAEALALGEDEL